MEQENKYQEGQIVFATVRPAQKLIIRRYVARIYYCIIQADPRHKELVYFERELQSDDDSPITDASA